MSLNSVTLFGLVGYALFNLGVLLFLYQARRTGKPAAQFWLLHTSIVSDIILVLYMLLVAGSLRLMILPIYAILLLKALCFWRDTIWMLFAPLLLATLYPFSVYIYDQVWTAGGNNDLIFWGLLISSIVILVLVFELARRRIAMASTVSRQLEQMQSQHAARVAELESINSDLRTRVRRQQALEESLRAISGSLSLDEVLSQILDSMLQMLGPVSASAVVLSRLCDEHIDHRTLSEDKAFAADTAWATDLVRYVCASQAPLLISDTRHESQWHGLQQLGINAALSVPLFDRHQQVLGALSVVSTRNSLFTSAEVRYLSAFSIQASVAIHNAELHSQLVRQGLLLEAVLRDIGDGLMVLDSYGALIMANPMANRLLQQNSSGQLYASLVELNRELRTGQSVALSCELDDGEAEHARHYQVYASLVHVAESKTDSPIAFVLHDITGQKALEQQRTEFISMVSHELRNPLNTLNGFLKVLLQEKVGPLNERQRDFLETVDERAETLKSRINELLEFNRSESGRIQLRLHHQRASLPDLIANIITRLQLQAKHFNLTLDASVHDDLPALLIDKDRIDQVLTNLIENAMKATPGPGSIHVSATFNEYEIRVEVRDTGTGIPQDQQQKIFSRFYGLGNKNSEHGVHLGLGLAICQQIVEGHHGRIWVESEEGKGSSFYFTLPLIDHQELQGRTIS